MKTVITTDRLALLDERTAGAKSAFFAHVGEQPETLSACAPCADAWWRPRGSSPGALPNKDRLCAKGKVLHATWWGFEGRATAIADGGPR